MFLRATFVAAAIVAAAIGSASPASAEPGGRYIASSGDLPPAPDGGTVATTGCHGPMSGRNLLVVNTPTPVIRVTAMAAFRGT